MRPAIGSPLASDLPLGEAAARITGSPDGQLAVVDAAGAYRGIVTARALADVLAESGHEADTVASLVEYPSPVSAGDPLPGTLDVLATSDGPVPVLDRDGRRLLGWLSHQDVLRALCAGQG
jgi:CIC family chloride channel protein